MTKPVQIGDVKYPSRKEAAAALGVSRTTLRLAIKRGSLDRLVAGERGVQPMPVRIRGVDYASPKAAAAAFGINVQQVYRRIDSGRADEIGLPNRRGQYLARPITIGDVRFASISEADRALGFRPGYVKSWLERGSRKTGERILRAVMQMKAKRESERMSRDKGVWS